MKNEKLSDQQLLTVSGSALYGARWQTELARDLGLSDGRRVRQWLSGDRSVPIGVWRDIDKLINERRGLLLNASSVLNYNKSISESEAK